ncbi:ABC transporter ATP-binding protein [Flindersiella endophytica]
MEHVSSETLEVGKTRKPTDTVDLGDTDILLKIEGLKTHFFTSEGVVKAVDGVDISVPKGKTVCVVGESGCGKSITARSVMQLVDPPGKILEGKVHWRAGDDGWVDLAKLGSRSEELRRVRGGEIGMVFQEPMASLSPMYTVGDQLIEAILLHQPLSKEKARERAIQQLRTVGIPQPEQRIDAYPFQLSGGMCQRVMIAIALSCDPVLLIADEPTTALDVTTQARILDLLQDLQEQTGMAMMFITHDLGVVAEIADEVVVMYLGTVVEQGSVDEIFSRPKHPYTKALLRSIPTMRGTGERQKLAAIRGMVPHPQNRPAGCPFHTRCEFAMPGVCDTESPDVTTFEDGHLTRCHLYGDSEGAADGLARAEALPVSATEAAETVVHVTEREAAPADAAAVDTGVESLLELVGVNKYFPIKRGMFSRTLGNVRAVDGVNLTIRPGETLGLVGESGCGKTTLGRCIARIHEPTAGNIFYRDENGKRVDLAALPNRDLKDYRRQIRMIFQDPFSSLNPRMTLEQLVGEPLRNSRQAQGSELRDRVEDMLSRVGLRPEYARRYPHAFSGGERQRINIARALITGPRLVICDEAVSALDVSVRAQVLNLLSDLQEQFDLTYLFISHDLSVVEHISDRVTVMYLGKVVETTDTATLYSTPHHPYTEALLHAVPLPDPTNKRARHEHELPDDLPDPSNPPPGCPFHTRCPHLQPELCKTDVPDLRKTADGHFAACHHVEKFSLTGVAAR